MQQQMPENLRPMLDLNGSEFLAAGFIYDLAIRVIRAFLASRLTLRTLTTVRNCPEPPFTATK